MLRKEKAKLQTIFIDSCVCIDWSTFNRSVFIRKKKLILHMLMLPECFHLLFSPADEKVDRALHLSLAALLGSDIYNFGELVGCTVHCV